MNTRRLLVLLLVMMTLTACYTGAEEDAPGDAALVPPGDLSAQSEASEADDAAEVDTAAEVEGNALTKTQELIHADTSTYPFDARFIDSMIVHHEQGIAMAQMAVEQAENAELREMAEQMIEDHEAEIAQLREWREDWYGDLEPTGGLAMDMFDSRLIVRDDTLPFDHPYLQAMIPHHASAIRMARMAMRRIEHEELREMAETLIEQQSAEMVEMHAMLVEINEAH